MLLDKNFKGNNSRSVCVTCWCLCHRYQTIKHKEMGHELVTPRFCRDEGGFISLAFQNNRFKTVHGVNIYQTFEEDPYKNYSPPIYLPKLSANNDFDNSKPLQTGTILVQPRPFENVLQIQSGIPSYKPSNPTANIVPFKSPPPFPIKPAITPYNPHIK